MIAILITQDQLKIEEIAIGEIALHLIWTGQEMFIEPEIQKYY